MTTLLGAIATGTWSVDPAATSARFTARDVLRKPVEGILPVQSGGVEVSPEGVPLHIWADLDLGGVDTGNARRDRDLRGPRFFDVERRSVLRFSATPDRGDRDGHGLLTGELALGDVRCTLPVQVEVTDLTDARVRVRASAVLDRRDLGINVPRLLVGRAVTVAVDAELEAPAAGEPA